MSTYIAISSKKSNGVGELALNSIPVWLSVIFFISLITYFIKNRQVNRITYSFAISLTIAFINTS